MTILFLEPVAILGGAERCLLDLAASIRAADPSERMAMIVGSDGPLVDIARRIGVDVRVLPLPRSLTRVGDSAIAGASAIARSTPSLLLAAAGLASYAVQLEREVRRIKPTIVHSNGMKMHVLSAMVPLSGTPVVWHVRDFVGQRAIMARALRVLEPRVDGIFVISKSIAEDVRRTLGRDDTTLVYDAIDTDTFVPDGDALDLDALAGLPPASPSVVRIGLVATYARWKGQEVFLNAAARLAVTVDARFYIIGGPTYDTDDSQYSVAALRARIEERGLGAVAGLVPFQAQPENAYRALDIAVHASTRPEPFGRTIAESMACGRALVTAREGGAAELVEHDVDALAIAPRDPAVLARTLHELVLDPARRLRLGKAARATAVRRYSRSRIGPETLSAYERLRTAR